jgi:hypothetical protein
LRASEKGWSGLQIDFEALARAAAVGGGRHQRQQETWTEETYAQVNLLAVQLPRWEPQACSGMMEPHVWIDSSAGYQSVAASSLVKSL